METRKHITLQKDPLFYQNKAKTTLSNKKKTIQKLV